MTNNISDEVYEPEEQIVYNDEELISRLTMRKIIQDNLIKKLMVADLDRDNSIDDFLKIDYAHAIGHLEGSGSYEGVGSQDETWMYEFTNGTAVKHGGIAVVRKEKVVDYYPIWESI